MEKKVGMLFRTGGECSQGWNLQFVYDTNRSAFLTRDLVGWGVNGNWQVWVQYCGGEAVSIHTVRKGAAGFYIYTVHCIRLGSWIRTAP